MKKPINIRMDSELWEKVQRSAVGRGMTATAVVEEALRRVLKVDLPEFKERLAKIIEEEKPVLDRLAAGPSDECPYTAKQLSGRSGLPVAVCQHQIDRGTWRTLL